MEGGDLCEADSGEQIHSSCFLHPQLKAEKLKPFKEDDQFTYVLHSSNLKGVVSCPTSEKVRKYCFLFQSTHCVNSQSSQYGSTGEALQVGESGVALQRPILENSEITDRQTQQDKRINLMDRCYFWTQWNPQYFIRYHSKADHSCVPPSLPPKQPEGFASH